MKKFLLIQFFLLLITQQAFSQSSTDSITIITPNLHFKQAGKRISLRKMAVCMRSDPAALQEINSARTYFAFYGLTDCVGCGLLGWSTGTYMGGGHINWGIAAAGIGLIGISIPLSIQYSRHAKRAVAIFNHSLRTPSSNRNLKINFGLAPAGLSNIPIIGLQFHI